MPNPNVSNRSISRRTFLRGSGALLALPFLESLGRVSAFAATKAARPPLRMGIFTVTGGTVLESWRMPQAGPLTKLPSILRPLDFCKDDLLLLTGLSQSGSSENTNAHEHCSFMHLSCVDKVKREGGKPIAGLSVDQAVANSVGRDTVLPSLEIGLSNHETIYSFRQDGTPVPYENDPRLVFERMFRGRKPVAPNWSRRAENLSKLKAPGSEPASYERSVLDLVFDQAKSMRQKLSREDQGRMEEYLGAVRSVEKRLELLEIRQQLDLLDAAEPGSSQPEVPARVQESIWKNQHVILRDPERHREYLSLMADLMVLALQTDMTRVCTFAAGSDGAFFPGVVTVGFERYCHTLEHQGNAGRVEDADPISREACRQIHAWYTEIFAEMVRKMKAIDEGGSSLLDNTLLLYTSYMADGGHGRDDYPILLAGNAQGTLKTGRQIDFQRKTPVANLYVEMMNRMGVATENFGNSQTAKGAAYNGRLPGLV